MSDEHDEDDRILRILGRSAPALTLAPFETLRSRRGRPSARRSLAITLATVVVALAALVGGSELAAYRQQQQPAATAGIAGPSATASPRATLPQPIAQPITRTSPAAQVAWLGVYPQGGAASFVGVDPTGKVVGQLEAGQYWRSADGALLFRATDDAITAFSAADGKAQRSYSRDPVDRVADVAFSPDRRWLALIGGGAYVQVIDLRTGLAQITPLGHAVTSTNGSGSTLLFSPDSKRLFTIVDWAGPLSLTTFDVTPAGLVQTARAVDGQGGKTFPGCGGPGLAPKVVGGGQTLVLFCHVDGSVVFIDLPTLTTTTVVHPEQKNPFWLSPIFTPDGQLLYLHQLPAFGDFMQVVDLRSHALLGPVPTPTKTEQPGPFSWLFTTAYAGGVASTVPVSPDGLKVYSAATGAVVVLRVPDLKPLATLAQGYSLNEVWIAGDGKTVFATDGGKGVLVMHEDGSGQPITVTLPAQIGGFIASEHG